MMPDFRLRNDAMRHEFNCSGTALVDGSNQTVAFASAYNNARA
jgi:hypothetical protein